MEPIERQCHRMKTSQSSVARIVCRSSSSQRRRSPAGVSQGDAAHPQLILYGVSRHDFATLAGVAVLMCLVTGVATYSPARRAASVDPIAALRQG